MGDPLQTAFQHLAQRAMAPESLEPYPFQQAVAEALLAGKRVVLRAPHGSGKESAALLPWVASRLYFYDFPPKLIYTLPGGTLFHDTQRRLHDVAQELPETQISVQTEGDSYDPFFLADAVVTSTDQLLGIAVHRPQGLHPSLCNVNAGVLLGSYLIFNEFPALHAREPLLAWLGLLRKYYPTTRCLWTTGVLPRAVAQHIAQLLGAEYLEANDACSGGGRVWSTSGHLNPEGIMRRHRERTLVICNTVRGAQTLYRALSHHIDQQQSATELLLLHQYQFTHDRLPVEERITSLLRPGSQANVIVITTSGCEVGTDISADLLISDPAPADQLLQRAAHCARGNGEEGQMLVAHVSGVTADLPHTVLSADGLLHLLADGAVHSSTEELAAMDMLWEEGASEDTHRLPTAEECDTRALQAIAHGLGDHLFSRVSVALHRVPEMVQDPFELARFSLALSSLKRGWQQWQAHGNPGEWYALAPQWPTDGQHAPNWSLVTDPQEFRTDAQIIILNAEAVSYDPVIGLELVEGTAYQSERLPAQHTIWSPFDQHVESYAEHAMRALTAFEQHVRWYRYVLRHLGAHWKIPAVTLEEWIRLCVLWHDAGKLTADWQRAAYRWQEEVMRRRVDSTVLARVDYQSRRDGRYPCPAHAQATGQVLSGALTTLLGDNPAVLQGIVMALGHHHGVSQAAEVDLTPHPEAWVTLLGLAEDVIDVRMLRRIDHTGWTMRASRHHSEVGITLSQDPNTLMSYSLLTRAIRLSDREMALATTF